jgi:N-acyl-D-aspartate/D-glutamate deacylase
MSDAITRVIRGGTIVDGSGNAPFVTDIAMANGKITAIGRDLPPGDTEMDASGKLVTPGFIDVHTHYDAQVTWSHAMTPTSWHGVTTAMIGNCGVGFAPCLPSQRDMLVKLMEGVEDIPEVVLTAGIPWNWTTFPEYLDALDARHYDIDVVTQVPHAALRVYVMGERGADREPATSSDRAEMARLAGEGIRAGALGFSTSRTLNHKTIDGEPIATLGAAEAELTEIALALREAGAGWMQVVSDFDDPEQEFALLQRLAEKSGRPMTITLLQYDRRPDGWRRLLDSIGASNAAGTRITGQIRNRPTGVLLGWEISQNPFMARPAYQEIAHLPFEQRLAVLRQPEFRARLLAEAPTDRALAQRTARWDRVFLLGDPPEYEPSPETSVAARAVREGRDPDAVAYDLLLGDDGKAILYRPMTNYTEGNLDAVRNMIADPNSLIGLGDGGAHVGIMCDASATSYMLTHWTRDRARGGLFSVAEAVKMLTHDCAAAIGLHDRGLLQLGYKADINVIDYDRLHIAAPEVIYDLPGGGKRLIQRTEGYVATLVSGVPVYLDGVATGALPGRLVRGEQRV